MKFGRRRAAMRSMRNLAANRVSANARCISSYPKCIIPVIGAVDGVRRCDSSRMRREAIGCFFLRRHRLVNDREQAAAPRVCSCYVYTYDVCGNVVRL